MYMLEGDLQLLSNKKNKKIKAFTMSLCSCQTSLNKISFSKMVCLSIHIVHIKLCNKGDFWYGQKRTSFGSWKLAQVVQVSEWESQGNVLWTLVQASHFLCSALLCLDAMHIAPFSFLVAENKSYLCWF